MSTVIRGDRLRAARERLGLSQGQLGNLCEMAVQQIHRYETGKGDASAPGLKVIAEQLHVTTDYLLGLSDDPYGYSALQLREDERKLMEAYTIGDWATLIQLISQRVDVLKGQPQEKEQEQQ